MTLTEYPFIQNIPFEVYLEDAYQGQYLTSHFLSDFRVCPLLYKQKLNGEVLIDDTAAFQIGRATHALVLAGQDAFDEVDAVTPLERQQAILDLVTRICDKDDYEFDTFLDVVDYFKKLINLCKQMNYSEYKSEQYYDFMKQVEAML